MTGKEIKEKRKGLGLTQTELAEGLNSNFPGYNLKVSKSLVCRWEKETVNISAVYAGFLTQYFALQEFKLKNK